MIRDIVFNALRGDPALQSAGLILADGSNVWTADDVDTLPVRPAWVLRWGADTPGFGELSGTRWGGAWTTELLVWAHDDPGDYSRVDAMLERSRDVLSALVGVRQPGGTGWWLTQLDWRGDSGPTRDDGYRTITRYSTWQVAMGRR